MDDVSRAILVKISSLDLVQEWLWLLNGFISANPIFGSLCILSLCIVLLFLTAILFKRVFGRNILGRLAEHVPTNKRAGLLFGLFLLVLLFVATYKVSTYRPYNVVHQKNNERIVIILPELELTDDGHLRPSKFSEVFQTEIQRKLTPIKAIKYRAISLGRNDLPYSAHTQATFPDVLRKISLEIGAPFFYFFALRTGDRYQSLVFQISPDGYIEPKEKRARDFVDNLNRALTVFANKNTHIPVETTARVMAGMFLAVLAQSENNFLLENGMFNAAEENVNESISILLSTKKELALSVAFPKSSEISDLFREAEASFLFYKKIIRDYNLYTKALGLLPTLKRSPYLPFHSESDYIKWLLSKDEFSFYGRYIPVFEWPKLNTRLEDFVSYVAKTNPSELPFKKIRILMDEIIPGTSWVKSYYLTIFAFLRRDKAEIYETVRSFEEINTHAKDINIKHRMLIDALEAVGPLSVRAQ